MSLIRRTVSVGACAWLLTLAAPVAGAPSDIEISAVYRSSSCSPTCNPETQPGLASGARVSGSIEIHATARSDVLGVQWIRLLAQSGSDPRYYCIEEWEVTEKGAARRHYDWDTRTWPGTWPENAKPSNCNELALHKDFDTPTANGVFRLQVQAEERVNGEFAVSSDFIVRVENENQPSPSATPSSSRSATPSPSLAVVSPTVSASSSGPSASATASASPTGTASVAAGGTPTAPILPAGAPGRPIQLFTATVLLLVASRRVLLELRNRLKRT